jgi:hypothetical protein
MSYSGWPQPAAPGPRAAWPGTRNLKFNRDCLGHRHGGAGGIRRGRRPPLRRGIRAVARPQRSSGSLRLAAPPRPGPRRRPGALWLCSDVTRNTQTSSPCHSVVSDHVPLAVPPGGIIIGITVRRLPVARRPRAAAGPWPHAAAACGSLRACLRLPVALPGSVCLADRVTVTASVSINGISDAVQSA